MQPQKTRFSFSQTAAQQPERQRFSFSQTAPEKAPELSSFFPARGLIQQSSVTHRPKPKFDPVELLVPSRGFKDEEQSEAFMKGTTVKDKAVGTAKFVGEAALGISQLSRMGLAKLPGEIGKTFQLDEEGEKMVSRLFELTQPQTAEEAAVMRSLDYATLFAAPITKSGPAAISRRIAKAKTLAQAEKLALEVTKDASRAKQIALDIVGADTKKLADNLAFSLEKEALGNIAPKLKPLLSPSKKVSDIQPRIKSPVTTPEGRFSFSKTAPETRFSFSKTAPAKTGAVSPAPRRVQPAARDLLPEGASIDNLGRDGLDTLSEVLSKTPKELDLLPPRITEKFKTIAGSSGLNTDKKLPAIVEDVKTLLDSKPEVRQLIPETPSEGFLQRQVADIKEVLSTPTGRQGGHIGGVPKDFPGQARKSLSSADGTTKMPAVPRTPVDSIRTASVSKAAAKAPESPAVKEVVKNKQWEKAPVKTQAKDMQEIGKKVRNTDIAKGGTHIASDLIDGVPPIKNVTAKSRNFAKENQLPIELPDQTLFEHYFLSNVQDLAHRLGHLQKHLTERGVKITDDMNAYLQREAFIGRAAARIGKVNKALGMEAGNPGGLFNRMRKDNIEVDDLAEYMSAKNAADRNSQVAKRNADVPDGGSGMTTKEAADIIKRYEGNTGIQKYAEEFRELVIKPRMKMLVDEGIISAEEAARITKYEPFYVPSKIDPPKGRFDIGKGFSVTNKGVKGLRGSTRTDRTNSVMQAVADYHNSIRLAEKNKSLSALAKLIREVPDDSFWKIRGVKHKPQYNKQGEIEFLSPLPSKEDNVVSFFENGKRMEIEFADGALAKVFTEQGVTPPLPLVRGFNNYLRAVNTVINPEFMITNAIRDLQTALILAGGEKGMVVASKIVKDYRKAGVGIWGAVRKGDNTGWAKTYNEMVEAGGRTGWFDMMTVPEQTKQVSKSISRYNSTKTSDSLMRAVDSTGKLISDMNEVAEMSVRVSAYKQLVDGGMTKTAAANYAKNMTVNFNKRGNWGLTMNSLYLFANAGVQGSARIIMAQKNPTVRKITAGVVGSSYALNELNYMINPEGYERIQDFEKERNLIVMLPLDGNKYNLPGISGDPRTGYYLKTPLPYGFNVFKVAGDVAYDVVNKKKSMAEGMATLLSATNAAFNPLSSGSGLQMVSPTVTDPIASLYENKNWFGGPVMPDQPAFAPQVRQSDRYFSGARDMSVGTAQFLNRLSGGNKVTAGTIDISPEAIDLVIDTLGGGLGNFLATSLDTGINVAQGEMPVPEEMPFVRKLIDKPFERGEQSTVFELLEKSANSRMSTIETDRFVDNLNRGLDMGQIEVDTYKRVLDGYITNAARQEAGEYVSLVEEGKQDKAIELLQNAPPGIAKEIVKLLKTDLEDEIKELEKNKK